MALTEKDIKKISVGVLIVLLAILAFLIMKPVLLSVIGGLILAYIFYPVYKWVQKRVKSKSWSAAIVSILVLAIIFIPLWFLVPSVIQQVFKVFGLSQQLDINGFIRSILPTASEQIIAQVNNTINAALGEITSSILDRLVGFIIDFARIGLHLLLVAFVFFFTLRDGDKLRDFVSGLSPLNRMQEKHLVNQFKDITDSIVYGQIVIGVVQGVLAGVGFFAFGVPNALLLTIIAIILSIIPIIGPAFVYVPVSVYLLLVENPALAIGYLLYNILIVSSVDNILRAHIVSRKTQISQVIIIIGMVGGLFIFGILGLILGPLILAYFLIFLRAYKEKNLSSLFGTT